MLDDTRENPSGYVYSANIQHVQPAAAVRSPRSRKRVLDGCAKNRKILITHHALAVAKNDLAEVITKTTLWM